MLLLDIWSSCSESGNRDINPDWLSLSCL